jgi:hypothetical protein
MKDKVIYLDEVRAKKKQERDLLKSDNQDKFAERFRHYDHDVSEYIAYAPEEDKDLEAELLDCDEMYFVSLEFKKNATYLKEQGFTELPAIYLGSCNTFHKKLAELAIEGQTIFSLSINHFEDKFKIFYK